MEFNQPSLQLVEAASEPLTGHNGRVWSVSWSPDPCNGADSMLASSGEDGSIIWHCHGSHWSIYEKLENKSEMSINTCAWRHDGKVLAAGGCNSRVILWEYKEDKGSFECITELNAPWNHVIKSVSWNKDGEYLLFCTEDGVCNIAAMSNNRYETQKVVTALDLGDISCGAWHPSENHFVVSGFQKFKIYEARKSQIPNQQATLVNELCSIGAPTYNIECKISAISYSNTGRIVSACVDGTVLVWELEVQKPKTSHTIVSFATKKLLPKLTRELELFEPIICIDWLRCESNLVAIGCLTNTILIYSEESDPVSTYAHHEPVNDVKWHPQNGMLASASSDGTIKLWKVHKHQSSTKRLRID